VRVERTESIHQRLSLFIATLKRGAVIAARCPYHAEHIPEWNSALPRGAPSVVHIPVFRAPQPIPANSGPSASASYDIHTRAIFALTPSSCLAPTESRASDALGN